jgi:hypothetical protein
MASLSCTIRHLVPCAVILCTLLLDAARFLRCCLRSPTALAAENLFLRKQLALYQARHVKPRRATDAIRVALVWLSQWFDWPQALTVVQPETFSRWRRQGYHLFWHWTPCPGRPPIPIALQGLIRQIARDNLTWGQRRIANELRLKLGLRVSPRTVRKYMPTHLDRDPGHRVPVQRWRTFVRNHAWDLIVRGVSVDFIRDVQALSVPLIQFPQRWWRHAVSNRVQGTPQGHAVAMLLPSTTMSGPVVWSADTVEVISVDQRSPPDGGPSCPHAPGLATRATSVDIFDVCPAGAVLCRWNRASPHTRGARPLSKGVSRVVPWSRAA